jgi:hypothetical protein
MSDLESLLRRAKAERITCINIDSATGVTRVGAWKAFSGYTTAYHADPVMALTDALTRAISPTDLSNLLD